MLLLFIIIRDQFFTQKSDDLPKIAHLIYTHKKERKKTNGNENLNTTISRYNGTFVAI